MEMFDRTLAGWIILCCVISTVGLTVWLRGDGVPAVEDSRAVTRAREKTVLLREQETQERIMSAISFLPFRKTAFKVAIVALIGIPGVSLLMFVAFIGRAKVNRSRLVSQRIGDSELTIDIELTKEKNMMLILSGMVQAWGAKDAYPEKFLQFTDTMLSHVEKTLSIVNSNNRLAAGSQSQPIAIAEGVPMAAGTVPSFAELLTSGTIAPGKDMILAYDGGQPIRGSFEDIYSSAIAGESGSGKTSTELFLLGSGLVTGGVDFRIIDPHYPHKKSLGKQIEPLIKARVVQFASYYDDILIILQDICTIIDERLAAKEEDGTPTVLVIDELAFLAKTSIAKDLFFTMERISTEGRKCAVYMLAASQTWLTARTGGNSVVRDTLTSAYVHRMKPKQAAVILQDKDEVDIVRKQVKKAGEVLLLAVGEDSRVCRMPLATAADMQTVSQMIVRQAGGADIIIDTSPVDAGEANGKSEGKETENIGKQAEKSLYEQIDLILSLTNYTQSDIADYTSISGKDLSQWRSQKSMTDDRKSRIESSLEITVNAIFAEMTENRKEPENLSKQAGNDNLIDFAAVTGVQA